MTDEEFTCRMERIQEDIQWKAEMIESIRNTDAFLERLTEKHQDNPSRERTVALASEAIESGHDLILKYEMEMTALRRKRDELDEEYRLEAILRPEPLI